MKNCRICGKEKEDHFFYKGHLRCKECYSKKSKDYYKENADSIKSRVKHYPRKKEVDKNYREKIKNTPELLERKKKAGQKYIDKNKDSIKENAKIRARDVVNNLDDEYIKAKARRRGLPTQNLNPDIIDILRSLIKIKRYVKEKTSNKSSGITLQNGGKVRGLGKRGNNSSGS